MMSFRLSRVEAIVLLLCGTVISSLIVPGLLTARESSREHICQDRLRLLGEAFQRFESAQGGLPPRRTGFNDGNPYGGWGGHILPYLKTAELKDKYDLRYDFFDPKNQDIVATSIPAFLCPASPADRFVHFQSQASTKSLNPDKETVLSCKAAVSDFIASNGVLMTRNGYGINSMNGDGGIGNQRQPLADNVIQPVSKITDGLSTTLLLIEQAGRPSAWRNKNEKPGDGQFGMSPNARGAWAGWGSIAFGAANTETGEVPGRGDHTDCSVNCNNWFGIYGFHEKGANVLFCDGSVRFMGTRLDPLTFAYLTIRDDGHLIQPEDY